MDTTLVISLSENQAHLALIQCKNPYSALLYVYGCANGGYINLSFAKEELEIDDFSLKKAADCLLAYGICKVKKDRVSEIKGDFDEIAALRDTDYGFAGICQMYESAKGKIMRPPEIESLYNIYVNLNMSADMITLLIGFLNEKGRFSLRNIEKTASEWHDAEITSYEAAEEYLNRKFAEKTVYRDILKLLGISGRDAVADEKKYIDRWLKADISHSLISLAYEKTIYNIHELKWPYIDKILSNWNKSGYKTPEDVEKGEKSPPAKPEKADSERDKIARLLEIYEASGAERLILLGDILYHGPRNDLPKEYAPKQVIAMLNQYKNEIYAIRGNCDTEVDQMVLEFPIMADYGLLCFDGLTFYATHGHVYNEDHLPPMQPGDILIHGHTHLLRADKIGDITVLNPGSVSIPKGGNPNTYALLDGNTFSIRSLDGDVVKELELERTMN